MSRGSCLFACPEPFDRLRTGLPKGGSWFEADRSADTSAQAHHERLKLAENGWLLTTNGGCSPQAVSGSCVSRVYVNRLLLVLNRTLAS